MDIGDIIIIAAAVIGTAVSAFSKNAKKKANAGRPATPSDYEWEESGESEPEFESVLSPTDNYESIYQAESQPERWSYDRQAIEELASSPQVDDNYRKKKAAATPPTDNVYDGLDKNKSHSTADAAKEFNVRDAIIYSELLKPKFKEY